MATRKYSVDLGANAYTVTEAAGAATTLGLELTVDLAKILTKQDVIIALENLTDYLTRANWPPV